MLLLNLDNLCRRAHTLLVRVRASQLLRYFRSHFIIDTTREETSDDSKASESDAGQVDSLEGKRVRRLGGLSNDSSDLARHSGHRV